MVVAWQGRGVSRNANGRSDIQYHSRREVVFVLLIRKAEYLTDKTQVVLDCTTFIVLRNEAIYRSHRLLDMSLAGPLSFSQPLLSF